MIYVKDAPLIDKDPDVKVIEFIDKNISCRRTLPVQIEGMDIPESV